MKACSPSHVLVSVLLLTQPETLLNNHRISSAGATGLSPGILRCGCQVPPVTLNARFWLATFPYLVGMIHYKLKEVSLIAVVDRNRSFRDSTVLPEALPFPLCVWPWCKCQNCESPTHYPSTNFIFHFISFACSEFLLGLKMRLFLLGEAIPLPSFLSHQVSCVTSSCHMGLWEE